MPKRYSVEIHTDESPSAMILRDMIEDFIRRMILHYIGQFGLCIDYNRIQIPDDEDRCSFVANSLDGSLVLITVIYC